MLSFSVHDSFKFKLDRPEAVLPPGIGVIAGDGSDLVALVIDDPTGERNVFLFGREDRVALHVALGETIASKVARPTLAVPRGIRR